MDKENVVCVSSWDLVSHYKERNLICSEMGGIVDHHAR
jgi:hypothetical protein